MKISIIAVEVTNQMSKAGKAYEQAEVTFKNLTFGKTETKKLMPFGAQKDVFNSIKNSQPGQVYDITVVKNGAGYNDWTAASMGSADSPEAPRAAPAVGGSQTVRQNTFETPEERAKKQVYIVRQSSLSSAIGTLSVGAKAAPKAAEVIDLAKQYEAYVFDTQVPKNDETGFDDLIEDVPL